MSAHGASLRNEHFEFGIRSKTYVPGEGLEAGCPVSHTHR